MHSTESANIDDAMVLGFVGLLVVICDGFGRGRFSVGGGRWRADRPQYFWAAEHRPTDRTEKRRKRNRFVGKTEGIG